MGTDRISSLIDLIKLKTGSFTAKIFFLFTVFVIILFVSFTSFFIYYQSNMMHNHLIDEGKQLANLITHELTLGVFAENEALFQASVAGMMKYDEIIMVQVFTDNGTQLTSSVKPGYNIENLAKEDSENYKNIFETLKTTKKVLHFEKEDSIEFWGPITAGGNYSEEDMYFKNTISSPKEYIIGFVRFELTTQLLNNYLKEVLVNSLLIPVLFIIPGWLIAYFIVTGITRPLKKLIHGVKAIETYAPFEHIPVETEDDIGNLAKAFNEMADSLQLRETENQALELQLRQAQKMKAIGALAGGIAHDFNNIISVIKGYARMLEKNGDSGGNAKLYVKQILSSSAKAEELTIRLLTFGREQIINPTPVNINDIIRNVEPMLERLFDDKFELRLSLSEEELIVVADTIHMDQVLMNLITNARDSMPGGGLITISTTLTEKGSTTLTPCKESSHCKYVVISLTDHGTGIDLCSLDKIFDPFFTTKDEGLGTGLGLSIVYGIINQHKGHIDVKSALGKGSTFNIYLPFDESGVGIINCSGQSVNEGI